MKQQLSYSTSKTAEDDDPSSSSSSATSAGAAAAATAAAAAAAAAAATISANFNHHHHLLMSYRQQSDLTSGYNYHNHQHQHQQHYSNGPQQQYHMSTDGQVDDRGHHHALASGDTNQDTNQNDNHFYHLYASAGSYPSYQQAHHAQDQYAAYAAYQNGANLYDTTTAGNQYQQQAFNQHQSDSTAPSSTPLGEQQQQQQDYDQRAYAHEQASYHAQEERRPIALGCYGEAATTIRASEARTGHVYGASAAKAVDSSLHELNSCSGSKSNDR